MLYLAEVQKQKGGLLGSGAKTELKLLACQRTDQNWSTVQEEVISAEEASKLNDGALVLVEINPNRQVQRIQEAGRPLVNILQNFSRQLEKFKLKEEEIDQWKQSLTFQAQELNRREMDMEARLEQLQQMEDDVGRLEAQQQEMESSRQEMEKLQQEIERNRQELEGAWEHLRGEQRRLEEHQADCQQGNVLDPQQSRALSELLERLSDRVAPMETVGEYLQRMFASVEKQQATLTPHWQCLEQDKTVATQQQQEINRFEETLGDRQNAWEQARLSLAHQEAELKASAAILASKQDYLQVLKTQLKNEEDLYQQIQTLAASSGDVSQKIDVKALENMPLAELEKVVQDLAEKFNIDSSFVDDQEQELKYKQETIEDIQNKINQASDRDVINLEIELADEQDLYQMLNQTLVGQRRNLLQRQKLLKQHQNILLHRQGHTVEQAQEPQIDLSPILSQTENQRQQKLQELQKLEREIEQIRAGIELTEGMIHNQTQDLADKRQEIKLLENNLLSLKTATAECWGRVNLYQKTLQPIQDDLDNLQAKLEEMAESLAQVQEIGDEQQQAIAQIRQTLLSFMSQPELLAS
ncbi:pilus motility taxis protein HmpF [Fortiea contorta]|uniref:pilus motility taxis protein HmpF n=1 Tax=Fortiea contorta TaxID=1892405 RepID=UPI00034ACBB4|nr:pilus motility taxis protein HmpF [Fortiea contorta]